MHSNNKYDALRSEYILLLTGKIEDKSLEETLEIKLEMQYNEELREITSQEEMTTQASEPDSFDFTKYLG